MSKLPSCYHSLFLLRFLLPSILLSIEFNSQFHIAISVWSLYTGKVRKAVCLSLHVSIYSRYQNLLSFSSTNFPFDQSNISSPSLKS